MVEVCPGGGCIAAQRPVGGVQSACEGVGGILPGGGRKALQLRITQVEVQRFTVTDKVGLGIDGEGAKAAAQRPGVSRQHRRQLGLQGRLIQDGGIGSQQLHGVAIGAKHRDDKPRIAAEKLLQAEMQPILPQRLLHGGQKRGGVRVLLAQKKERDLGRGGGTVIQQRPQLPRLLPRGAVGKGCQLQLPVKHLAGQRLFGGRKRQCGCRGGCSGGGAGIGDVARRVGGQQGGGIAAALFLPEHRPHDGALRKCRTPAAAEQQRGYQRGEPFLHSDTNPPPAMTVPTSSQHRVLRSRKAAVNSSLRNSTHKKHTPPINNGK